MSIQANGDIPSDEEITKASTEEWKADVEGTLNPMKDVAITSHHGIAAMALNFAMKYHDMTIVKDGVMYQQYKMEGKNFREIGLKDVFDTAILIENHLMRGHHRVGAMVQQIALEFLNEVVNDMPDGGEIIEADSTQQDTGTSSSGVSQ